MGQFESIVQTATTALAATGADGAESLASEPKESTTTADCGTLLQMDQWRLSLSTSVPTLAGSAVEESKANDPEPMVISSDDEADEVKCHGTDHLSIPTLLDDSSPSKPLLLEPRRQELFLYCQDLLLHNKQATLAAAVEAPPAAMASGHSSSTASSSSSSSSISTGSGSSVGGRSGQSSAARPQKKKSEKVRRAEFRQALKNLVSDVLLKNHEEADAAKAGKRGRGWK